MDSENNISQPFNEGTDKDIERIIENARLPEFDNSGIKAQVFERIRQERRLSLRKRIIWSAISSAAAILLLVTIFVEFNSGNEITLGTAGYEELLSEGYKEITVPRGQRQEIELPDGSHIIANYNSRIIYPREFKGKNRKIFASGEVYVDVTKDPEHPFIVESEGFEIKVLGTKFNIDNRNVNNAQVVLVEGSIDILTANKQSLRMKPNDLVDVVDGDIAGMKKVDATDYISWINGWRNLSGVTLKNLAEQLSDYYGIQVVCSPDISDTKVYGKLELEKNLNEVISSINDIIPMKIKREGNTIYLEKKELN